MSGTVLTAGEWLALITHAKKWLANLRRAGRRRRLESRDALREVIRVVRQTAAYNRGLREGEAKSLERETELALLWTELSFKLEDLGITGLAKRCRIKGMYLADPDSVDQTFLTRAGVGLADVERLARLCLLELDERQGSRR